MRAECRAAKSGETDRAGDWRFMTRSLDDWMKQIRAGDVRAIARGVTAIEGRTPEAEDLLRISTGCVGLDNILGGGFDGNRLYLYEGRPGTGKTTIALQFLLEGVRHGERVLYVTLSETHRELRVVAQRHGWTLDGIDVFDGAKEVRRLD